VSDPCESPWHTNEKYNTLTLNAANKGFVVTLGHMFGVARTDIEKEANGEYSREN
jgi:hypothetical protein